MIDCRTLYQSDSISHQLILLDSTQKQITDVSLSEEISSFLSQQLDEQMHLLKFQQYLEDSSKERFLHMSDTDIVLMLVFAIDARFKQIKYGLESGDK